jgi:hypothetical protein
MQTIIYKTSQHWKDPIVVGLSIYINQNFGKFLKMFSGILMSEKSNVDEITGKR